MEIPMFIAKTNMTTSERKALVHAMLLEGASTPEIAKALGGVSKQRVSQIIMSLLKDGVLAKSELPREQRKAQAKIEYTNKWGHSREECEIRKTEIYKVMREKFRIKKSNNYKHDFTIQFGELSFPTHCPVLGIELDYFAEMRQENSVSFDRIDSSKGYISGNVIVMSWRANRIKNDGTGEEHQKIADFLRASIPDPS
jgi:transposase